MTQPKQVLSINYFENFMNVEFSTKYTIIFMFKRAIELANWRKLMVCFDYQGETYSIDGSEKLEDLVIYDK